jgi:GNAT superfamily N-acetyltransferase
MPSAAEHELHATLKAWATGWSLSRTAPAPVEARVGYRIDVGLPGHRVRYVLPRFDRELVTGPHEPGTWLKIAADPGNVELDDRWQVEPVEYLMTSRLDNPDQPTSRLRHPEQPSQMDLPPSPRPLHVRPASEYEVRTVEDGALVRVRVELEGLVAARGQIAVSGAFAVVDQVATEPEYRRRGLGSVVMAALGRAAVRRGATSGVLVATEDGRALYSRLGWKVLSPITPAWVSRG